MSDSQRIEIRRLDASEVRAGLDGLASVLADCVEGGASVGYLMPFSHEDARQVYETYAAEVEQGRRLLLAAFLDVAGQRAGPDAVMGGKISDADLHVRILGPASVILGPASVILGPASVGGAD